MKRLVLYLEALGDLCARILAVCAGSILVVMVLLGCANIAGRAMGMPIRGTFELIGFMGAMVAGLSLAFAQRRKAHIFVAFFMKGFPRRLRLALDVAVHLCSALFFALAAHALAAHAGFIAELGELSETLHLVFYPFIYMLAAGCVIMAVVLGVACLKALLFGEEG